MEIFKDIVGYEGLYQISNFGNVKTLRNSKLLKPRKHGDGYLHVALFKNNRKDINCHVLVAKHFILNPENKLEVNHIDGDKTNNYVDNLEWNTRAENARHAGKHKLMPTGENHYYCKLTDEQVQEIRDKYIPFKYTTTMLAKEYSVDRGHIHNIISLKTRNIGA